MMHEKIPATLTDSLYCSNGWPIRIDGGNGESTLFSSLLDEALPKTKIPRNQPDFTVSPAQ
jgi:hypothetical protein